METTNNQCSICEKEYVGYGNNAEPINSGRCCDYCNSYEVVPKRFELLFKNGELHSYRNIYNPENRVKSNKKRNADED